MKKRKEDRKGFPYARTGYSLFIEDANILIDTPEDINVSLNNSGIQKVEHILYSHCDPDHTMGMRVIERLKMDWLAVSIGKKLDNPLRKELFTLDEIDTIRNQYGIKEVIITHLEEDWGKSYDDYRELEKKLNLIQFAYDGLKIQL
ncbi:MAG: hypothetical protein K2J04_07875 [Lachnospiraceae bacterium]|nr:hypothetical protein [Lachnospiraceae bacterium]